MITKICTSDYIRDPSKSCYNYNYFISKTDGTVVLEVCNKWVVDKSDFNAEEYQKWINEKNAKIEEGLQLFAKYYQDLWL